MKNKYNPKHLTKKQRHMKKWIPNSIYCDDCKFWHSLFNSGRQHKREECQYNDVCDDNVCAECDEVMSYCAFLKYVEYDVEYGRHPLGNGCKVCGLKDKFTLSKYDWISITKSTTKSDKE